jgi:hypothetical protein
MVTIVPMKGKLNEPVFPFPRVKTDPRAICGARLLNPDLGPRPIAFPPMDIAHALLPYHELLGELGDLFGHLSLKCDLVNTGNGSKRIDFLPYDSFRRSLEEREEIALGQIKHFLRSSLPKKAEAFWILELEKNEGHCKGSDHRLLDMFHDAARR